MPLSSLNPRGAPKAQASALPSRSTVGSRRALIVGTDPVAVDTVGAHLLQAKRIAFFGEDRALDVTPHHITVADKEYHLGVSDLSRIQIVKLGWADGVLI
jgi:hypothetical protein